ncbi:MAG: PQQ-binding-like beta-propeller repeat protein [Actinobacteria bacterium]|nr:PQQ-binding-like beta-propeller repeat protein [Actinomycetota bacterium]
MKLKVLILRVICAAFLVMLATTASTAYAASWPMFQHDAQHTGFSPDERIRPPLELSWVKWPEEVYDEARTRPVVADGIVYIGQVWHLYTLLDGYVGTRGQLQAISLSTGMPMWAAEDLLVCSTPTLSNGRIYFGTLDGKFYALSAADGSMIWSFDAGSLPTSPTILGDYIYFGTFDGRLYALNAVTGEQRWMIERPAHLSAPAIANNTLFVGGDELLAVDPSTGNIKWSFRDDWGPCSTPVVKGGSVFVSCRYTLYCLNSGDGSVKWSYFTADVHGYMVTPSISESTLYWGAVTAINPATGQVKWTFDSQNDIHSSSVAIANGYVFVGSSHDTNGVFDHSDGRLYVLREDTGELVWQYLAGVRGNDWFGTDPSPAVSDGTVVLNLSTSQLCCFSMPPQPPSLLSLTASRSEINPYNMDEGLVDFSFELDTTATVTADILDYEGRPVRRLVDGELFGRGQHSITWYGLIDFPEMADPNLRAEFGDKCILIAPDGLYELLVTVTEDGGQPYTGSADIKVKADV